MNFPAFCGVVGETPEQQSRNLVGDALRWRRLWEFPDLKLTLRVRNADFPVDHHCWALDRRRALAVFVWGQPFVASDSEFDLRTEIERVSSTDLPHSIARLYRQQGMRAFEMLEGSFCVIIADSESREVLLVVDKFGCDDVYIRRRDGVVAFASHPSVLPGPPLQLDAKAAAFFLAHDGFVPAPFTLFDGVETIGRAKLFRIRASANSLSIERHRYWYSQSAAKSISRRATVDTFHELLDRAVESRCRKRNAILLSGGMDSSLLANLLSMKHGGSLFAMTGAVRGHSDSESEAAHAAALSAALGIAHESLYLEPRDQTLPDEWTKCVASWSGGTRITLPLFYRLARRARERSGEDTGTFSGQMADTLADNNYTLPSLGYTIRRMFFSPWFLRIIPFLQMVVPDKGSRIERFVTQIAKTCAGERFAVMAASVLDGSRSRERFYAGRVFGFGEMPGCSSAGFPLLSEKGFEEVADWYSLSFVNPIVSQMTPGTFYRDMMEFSMDMGMLHLDTRLVVHVLRLGGGTAELPFLDSRVVKFFASLPYKARSIYRRPKWVIERQFAERGYVRHGAELPLPSNESSRAVSFEKLLMSGSLGSYFRELLSMHSVFDKASGLMDFIEKDYCERQLRAFQQGLAGVNCKFIARVAALHVWSQACCSREVAPESSAVAIA